MSEQDKQCREAFEAWAIRNEFNITRSEYNENGYYCMDTEDAFEAYKAAYSLRTPQITVTKNESGQIVAVTRTDAEGKILEVIAESAPIVLLPIVGKTALEFVGSELFAFQEATGFDTADEYIAASVAAPKQAQLTDEAFEKLFEQFADLYNQESNEWLDMDVQTAFVAGCKAIAARYGDEQLRQQRDELLASLKYVSDRAGFSSHEDYADFKKNVIDVIERCKP